jgi:hypothetical protein
MENLNRDGVVDLLTKLNVHCGVIFWTIKNGCPLSNSYTLQVVGCWTCVDFESMGISFTYIPRCAICGRTDTPHKLSKCPLLATMNKIQGKEGYEQIVLTSEGEVVIKKVRLCVDVRQEMANMRSLMKLLMACVKKLEAAARE